MTDTASRQPKGIPVGGQFAPDIHAEPEATLAAAAPTPPAETLRELRGHDFYPPAEEMAKWPAIYDTDEVPAAEKPIVAHWFQGSIDFWVCEYDGQGEAFGYSDMGVGHGEWGYIPLEEVEKARGQFGLPIERDLDFVPGTLAKECIPKYRQEAAPAAVAQPAEPVRDEDEPPLWDGPDEPDPLTPEERKKWDERHRFAYNYGHAVLGVTGFEDRDTVEEFAGFAADAYRESGWNEDLDMHGVVDDWMAHRHPLG